MTKTMKYRGYTLKLTPHMCVAYYKGCPVFATWTDYRKNNQLRKIRKKIDGLPWHKKKTKLIS